MLTTQAQRVAPFRPWLFTCMACMGVTTFYKLCVYLCALGRRRAACSLLEKRHCRSLLMMHEQAR